MDGRLKEGERGLAAHKERNYFLHSFVLHDELDFLIGSFVDFFAAFLTMGSLL